MAPNPKERHMSLRDIKDDLLSLRAALYQQPSLNAPLVTKLSGVIQALNSAIEHQDFLDARPAPKFPLPPGWSFVLVREALPFAMESTADVMRSIEAGIEPPERVTRWLNVLKVTSPSGIVTECHDDEDRYAKLLADRDELLVQLKAVEAARDAERDELARERAENLNLRAKAALDAAALPFEGDDMTVRSALEGAWLKGIEAGAEMAVMPKDVVEGDVKAALDAFIRDHGWKLELRVKRRWAREQAYVAGLAKAQDELESERRAPAPEPAVERWVVSEIDVEDRDRDYYDLHLGDIWNTEPGKTLLRRAGAKGPLGISRNPDGTATAPFPCNRKVTFVRDVTGAEPAPEPERAPEIIKQVELSPTRGYDPALERRAEALADALFVKLYPTTGGTLMLRDGVAKDRHAEHLRHARAVLGLKP
jgi:hypothetical protein